MPLFFAFLVIWARTLSHFCLFSIWQFEPRLLLLIHLASNQATVQCTPPFTRGVHPMKQLVIDVKFKRIFSNSYGLTQCCESKLEPYSGTWWIPIHTPNTIRIHIPNTIWIHIPNTIRIRTGKNGINTVRVKKEGGGEGKKMLRKRKFAFEYRCLLGRTIFEFVKTVR